MLKKFSRKETLKNFWRYFLEFLEYFLEFLENFLAQDLPTDLVIVLDFTVSREFLAQNSPTDLVIVLDVSKIF